ncbi:peptidase MA family metallohydrolase [Propionibacteriaceae bacterium Y1700]|uniref:peptidase MA family metallohydrolase n=1 Tax=Microlunatus sp. Y1700 TaxID=3418487 RepID=UPI003DA6F6F6
MAHLAAAWAEAVTAGDRDRFDRVWTGSPERLMLLWDNLAGLGLSSFAVAGEPTLDDPRTAQLRVQWQVPGDRAPASHLLGVPVSGRGSDARLDVGTRAEVGAGPYPLWWLEPVRTSTADGVRVISGAPGPLADTVAATAATSLAEAVRLTGRHSRGVVLELPSTPQLMDRVLGDDRGSTGQIGALTWPAGPRVTEAPLRIVLNPLAMAADDEARRALLTHEITHVLTAAPERGVPLWVAEGYAELVAHDHDPDAGWRSAEPFLALLREGRSEPAPPGDDAFLGSELEVAYGQAWTLCRWLLEQSSWERVNHWYAALGEGAAMDDALQELCGRDLTGVQAGWQQWLSERIEER